MSTRAPKSPLKHIVKMEILGQGYEVYKHIMNSTFNKPYGKIVSNLMMYILCT